MGEPESKDTRRRVLDAAEHLFGTKGLNAVSLREITGAAGANVAAVNYHFGSKEGLLREVLHRRMVPLNRSRIEELRKVEEAAGDDAPVLEDVVRAFTAPTMRAMKSHPDFMRVVSRLQMKQAQFGHLLREDPSFDELVSRLRSCLIRALPGVPVNDLWWGVSFHLGAMIHTWGCWETIEQLSQGEAHYGDDEEMVERLVRFGAAGLRSLPRGYREREA